VSDLRFERKLPAHGWVASIPTIILDATGPGVLRKVPRWQPKPVEWVQRLVAGQRGCRR